MSASPESTGARIAPSWAGSCWPSPSTRTARSKPFSYAYRNPVWTAPPIPRLNGSRITSAPRSRATAAVRSAEPSATTTTVSPGSKARISSITRPTQSSSFSAGTIATLRLPRSASSGASRTGACATSATRCHRGRLAQADELEQAPRPPGVGVLVERALAGAAAELLGRGGVGEQLAVGLDRLLGRLDDEQLAPRLEPALDPGDRVGDDRRSRHRELERSRRRGGGD